MAQHEQRGGRQRDGTDRGVRGHDFQARFRRLVEPAHLAERIGGCVAAAPVVVDAPGPAVDVDPNVVEFEAAVEPGQWMAHHRLGRRELRLVPAVGEQLDRLLVAGCDAQVPARRPARAGDRAACRPVVDGRRADPRGPGVVFVVGLVDRIRLLERAVARTVRVEDHYPRVGDGSTRRRQQQRRAHPQRLRAIGIVRADESALVVRRLGGITASASNT